MTDNSMIISKNGDFRVVTYVGIGMVLFTMDLDENHTVGLAGFSIKCQPPGKSPFYMKNRLTFQGKETFQGYTKDTTPKQRIWFDSDESPYQSFRWLHVPSDIDPGIYKYDIAPMYFGKDPNKLNLVGGPAVSIGVDFLKINPKKFDFGFTKGYLSSQAYASRFKNADIRPKGDKTIDFDTKPFLAQYQWLGGKAHQMLFDFLGECTGPDVELKAMIYDCDHPDFISSLEAFGKRVKVILDNAPLHHNDAVPKPEDKVFKILSASSGGQAVRGKFSRFQHNKVLIKVVNGTPEKVFTGSANFSIRGLYVQANNCFVITDPVVASTYDKYFDLAYAEMSAGKSGMAVSKDPISKSWIDFKADDIYNFSICLSPHQDSLISLKRLQDALDNAGSSILFSIMVIDGGGEALKHLRELPVDKGSIFHYGIVQSLKSADSDDIGECSIHKQGKLGGTIPFSYLHSKIPEPFSGEFSGGLGQVIHDKFVVIDFNTDNPVVFTGSSNLAAGGEMENGDNLIAVYDREFAIAYAVEAVRLFDHYNFRFAMSTSTKDNPLLLDDTDGWTKKYFDPNDRKYYDRKLFTKCGG
ncbi:MAG: phospholipase D-like domain-containing protein [Bacteroidetes bacterium]|nr:phospholipase D-like domain-containing protein [Bacteroidota bacterium]